ncbi:MAG TPA: response regulator transcription factor [Nocardioides sp.]|jgi:two-component system nitrate/nitrite response regulator NarL|nr:response regulator transcription factor [uncultured Nocardioides sp.]HEX5987193.1 response regulator transcription factor [Nocardioides sp.]
MRIVICDDHQLLVQALATALGELGYVVEAAVGTPEDGVKAVALHDPDVLLVDVAFPVGSGLQTARTVLEQHPRTKVVMLTGGDAPESLRAALDLGVHGYIRKAQRIEDIAAALDKVAAGHQVIDQQLLHGTRSSPSMPRQRTPIDGLTPREQDVLRLLVDGCSTNEIVERMNVTPSTVRTHVQSIFVKMGVHSRLQAVALLSREGLLDRVGDFHGDAR